MSPPIIPALALSNALLYASPASEVLLDLQHVSDCWRDALVLATPFWASRFGKLNEPLDLVKGIPPLVVASLMFDPDRELCVRGGGLESEDGITEETKGVLSAARRIHFMKGDHVDTSACDVPPPTLMFDLMPSLTAVHLANSGQLVLSASALASLTSLEELTVTDYSAQSDLLPLISLTSLRYLSLGNCVSLEDISALASLTKLQTLRLKGYPDSITGRSALDSLSLLRECTVNHPVADPWRFDRETPAEEFPVGLLDTCVGFLRSDDIEVILQGALLIRKILCVGDDSPTEEAVKSGCIPFLVDQLLRDECPELQFESAWALSNITSGNNPQTETVVSTRGAVSNFVRLLSSPNEDCREQAAWGIGNFSGYNANIRDMCHQSGALRPMIAAVAASPDVEKLINVVWALSNLCRGKPMPEHKAIAPTLPFLANMLQHPTLDLVESAVWGLSYLADTDDIDRIQHVLDTGCLERVVELLASTDPEIRTSSLEIPEGAALVIAGVARGSESQVQAVLDAGALKALLSVMNDMTPAKVQSAAVSAIVHLTAKGPTVIGKVMDVNSGGDAERIFAAVTDAASSTSAEVRQHAVAALSNVFTCGSTPQVDGMVQNGALATICKVLENEQEDTTILISALAAVGSVLGVGAGSRNHDRVPSSSDAEAVFRDCGDALERLVSNTSPAVRDQADRIFSIRKS